MRTMRPMRCFVGPCRFVYFLRHSLAKCHIFVGAHPRGYHPQIQTRPRFLYSAPSPPKFHHPMFTRSEVIALTNKQTNKQTNRRHWKHTMLFTTTLGIHHVKLKVGSK